MIPLLAKAIMGQGVQELPYDWTCPVCGAEKQFFQSRAKRLAGFEQNQGYGFGSNSLTPEQKSLLIYGPLLSLLLVVRSRGLGQQLLLHFWWLMQEVFLLASYYSSPATCLIEASLSLFLFLSALPLFYSPSVTHSLKHTLSLPSMHLDVHMHLLFPVGTSLAIAESRQDRQEC